jgi:DNA mismatch endonuclease (patch repair protein)
LHVPGRRRGIRPDVAFPSQRVAVFVDGCFWHGCADHGHVPAANAAYWKPKLERNVARDRSVDEGLRTAGWRVVRIWEDVPPTEAVETLIRILKRQSEIK